MPRDLKAKYEKLIEGGDVFHDAAQVDAIAKLEDLRQGLESNSRSRKSLMQRLGRQRPEQQPGLYLWGGVGAGKSMLMDLFFSATHIERKRRVHFHAFMQEIHAAIHTYRKEGIEDPVQPVAAGIASGARLLCFDELQITDITDAMLVGRLFEQLLKLGTSIVITSNRVPEDLYKNGLNRQLFLPFIELLNTRLQVHHLFTETDYRQDRLQKQQTWFAPLGPEATANLDRIWQGLTGGHHAPLTLSVNTRDITLPVYHNGAGRISFAQLCERPLGPADFLAITNAVRVLIVDDIPKMSRANNNEAKRFVTFIDTAYEAGLRLICSAAARPEALYTEGEGAFEFERTASRLAEMQSGDWGS